MLFITANCNRPQLEHLTRLLVCTFPGSTIYQHTDPARMLHDALNHRADAVFLHAEKNRDRSFQILQLLRTQRPELPVFILAETCEPKAAAHAAGASGFLLYPPETAHLKDALSVLGK